MGLSTHVLDTMHGGPAAGMHGALFFVLGAEAELLQRFVLTADGRHPNGVLLSAAELRQGTYRLQFEVNGYFKDRGVALPQPPFLDRVNLDFGVADPAQHYHVPLLVSPWSYSTYRGS